MSLDKLLITTTGGNSIVDGDNFIFSHLVNNEYIKKQARELNTGELIRFRKECVSTSLEEVEPILEKSLRYSVARRELHQINNQGRPIPLLRKYLIEGIYPQTDSPSLSKESLERKILQNDDNFSQNDNVTLINYLQDFIKNNSDMTITRPAIANWIKGETIAPYDWEFFRVFEKLNPAFNDFDQNSRDPNSKAFHYRLFVTTRRVIMHYLDECKAKGTGEKKQTADPVLDRLSLAPEISLVVEYFFRDINEQYVDVRVTGIQKILKKSAEQHFQRTDKKLSKGIVTEKLDGEVRLCNDLELFEETNVLYRHLDVALKCYNAPWEKIHCSIPIKQTALYGITQYILMHFCDQIDEETEWTGKILTNQNVPNGIDETTKELQKNIHNRILNSILNNELDTYYKLNPGTIYKLVQTTGKLRTATPSNIVKYNILFRKITFADYININLNPLELEDLRAKAEHLKRQIRERYPQLGNIDGNICSKGIFLTNLLNDAAIFFKSRLVPTTEAPEVIRYIPKEDLFWLATVGTFDRGTIYTKENVKKILGKYGLAELISLHDFDYALDEMLQKMPLKCVPMNELKSNSAAIKKRINTIVDAAYLKMFAEKGITNFNIITNSSDALSQYSYCP
jgi:hypothetical protein